MAESANEMSDFLKEERRKRGWTQGDMSAVTGWHQTKVSKLEHGWCRPTLNDLEKLSDMFGTPLPKLLLMRKRSPQRPAPEPAQRTRRPKARAA